MSDHAKQAEVRAETAGGYLDAAKDAMDRAATSEGPDRANARGDASLYSQLANAEATLSLAHRVAEAGDQAAGIAALLAGITVTDSD